MARTNMTPKLAAAYKRRFRASGMLAWIAVIIVAIVAAALVAQVFR